MKISRYILIGSATLCLIIFLVAFTSPFAEKESTLSDSYSIEKTWKMPKSLNEISGIAWLGNNKIACIQDEEGIIFIYDLTASKIVEQFPFADAGDYEAITINNNTAFIMRSDGTIFKVDNYINKERKVSVFKSEFSSKNNMESLFYDSKMSRLLTTPKHTDLNGGAYKAIYEVSLKDKNAIANKLFKIEMNDNVLHEFEHKKSRKTLMPSEIAINPKTNEMYVLEGKDPKLLILEKTGKIKKVYLLHKDIFPQPEGITFSENGTLYISNEANKGSATILKVKLN